MNDDVDKKAKRAIGMDCLGVSVGMANLNERAENNECSTEETERNPKKMAGSRIEAALEHLENSITYQYGRSNV